MRLWTGVFYTDNEFKQMPLIQVTSGGQRSLLKKKLQACESQQSCLFVGDQILIFHHNLQINSLKSFFFSRLALNRGSRLDFTPRPTLFFSSLLASAVSSHLSIEETPSARLSKLENYGFDQLVSQRD